MCDQKILQAYQDDIYMLSITEMATYSILPEIELYDQITGESTWKDRVIGFVEASCKTGIADIDTGTEISIWQAIENIKNTDKDRDRGTDKDNDRIAAWYGYQLYSTAYGKELIKGFNIGGLKRPLSPSFVGWAKLYMLK
ncbi:Hypothetical protein GbCGDNIH1_5060 [Granulibacter bethesdensis CGDNIH1]|uniref:Uncharacterized protein n=2 Tax=Granulibacter bethesdensis TaxID=364410 RepID=A0A286M354_GRABC|nr:Hypothetical protein GbCGDNIH5_5060 [Granulibacter bethesdensis]APH65098.1 Hypothetical protein GbCGDNIH1I4_5060 [Granulibacter bethesdensis]ASV62453.1 Hypothetical protein GbCGDNIH1_5060 [Granulibacter bethesdensis CGDNIH1]